MLVIGTSAQVWPAAGYIAKARQQGARVAIINSDVEKEAEVGVMQQGDFAFVQDAAQCLPILLEPIIGRMDEEGEMVVQESNGSGAGG